jgi:hypothetical protein
MLLLLAAALPLDAQQPAPADTGMTAAAEAPADTSHTLWTRGYSLDNPVSLADTIPPGFFVIAEELGLNRYTTRLIGCFGEIPDDLILQALRQADQQIEYSNINAWTTAYAINLLCKQDTLWHKFFTDLDMQFREPNILRFNFRDDQEWKSYVLNDLFYSTFFQELLLRLGNIGIADSRDGKQWLEGWPDAKRWKYREYVFEYLPEDVGIRVLDPSHFAGGGDTTIQSSSVVRTNPLDPVLPVTPGDSIEPPFRVPKP